MSHPLGARLAQIRGQRGLTQPELAAKVGVHKNTIFNIEKTGSARFHTLEVIARALDVEISELTDTRPARRARRG
jgi:transcriptional regulator with XRE-family HTH domain